MSKLDDLLGKKKEIVPVLDISKTIVHTKEEYKRLSEKVPDYKMRPIKVSHESFSELKSCSHHMARLLFHSVKVRTEDIKIKEQESGLFTIPKKEFKYLIRHNGEREKSYVYLDPVPVEMRSIVIMELCTVPIDWKMLTTLRPKTKIEEEYYSKFVLSIHALRFFFSQPWFLVNFQIAD